MHETSPAGGDASPLNHGWEAEHLPAWLRPTRGEHRSAVAIAIIVLVVLQLTIPAHLAFQPWWLLPGLEVTLFIVLTIANPVRISRESTVLRRLGLALVAVAGLATLWSAGRLVYSLLHGVIPDTASVLLANGGAVWFTNVIVFALGYWELDRGGPAARANARRPHPDFLFPQMTVPAKLVRKDWEPAFPDYLYLAFTNATAFSPTDVMPLSRWAKMAMTAQAAVSMVVVLLVVARAINILR